MGGAGGAGQHVGGEGFEELVGVGGEGVLEEGEVFGFGAAVAGAGSGVEVSGVEAALFRDWPEIAGAMQDANDQDPVRFGQIVHGVWAVEDDPQPWR